MTAMLDTQFRRIRMWVSIKKVVLIIFVSLAMMQSVYAAGDIDEQSELMPPALSIEQAVAIALKNDPVVVSFQDKEQAFREASIAASALPDPNIKLGFMNFPTDTYKRNQEPMTQVQLGVSQMFPAGDSLDIKASQKTDFANAEMAKGKNQLRSIKRKTRKAWLELYYWTEALKVVKENNKLFKNLVNVTESNYAAGREHQQDVIRAELELELLADKEMDILASIKKARANLEKLIGNNISQRPLTKVLPTLNENIDYTNSEKINSHPMLQVQSAMVSASNNGVALAKQSYKPNWMVDLTYGMRDDTANGMERADFLSAMVKFSVPLFTGNLQDRKVAASKRRQHASLNDLEDKKRELIQMYQSNLSDFEQFSNRSQRYKKILLVKAHENSEVALSRYQSDRGKFTDLIRARMTELNMQLKALRLEINQHKSYSDLTYLVGEQS